MVAATADACDVLAYTQAGARLRVCRLAAKSENAYAPRPTAVRLSGSRILPTDLLFVVVSGDAADGETTGETGDAGARRV